MKAGTRSHLVAFFATPDSRRIRAAPKVLQFASDIGGPKAFFVPMTGFPSGRIDNWPLKWTEMYWRKGRRPWQIEAGTRLSGWSRLRPDSIANERVTQGSVDMTRYGAGLHTWRTLGSPTRESTKMKRAIPAFGFVRCFNWDQVSVGLLRIHFGDPASSGHGVSGK